MAANACPKCGAENPRSNRFCDSCGARLAAEPEAQAKPEARPEAKPETRKPAAKPARRAEEAAPAEAPALAAAAALPRWELWGWGAVLALGAFLRLWALGEKPLHHDESIHAWYAYKLFKGEPYIYDPAYHGPFRYHMNALMFFVFGVSDFSTRLLPAIVGILGLGFLWQWRGLLGRKGALFAAAMVALSPSWTYNARFIRDDIVMAVGALFMVWGLFKHFETRAPRYLVWAAAGLMASFTSHEGTWIFLGILGSFLGVRWLWERAESAAPAEADAASMVRLLAPPLRAPGADYAGLGVAALALGAGYATDTWNSAGTLLLGAALAWASVALAGRLLFYGSAEAQRLWRILFAVFLLPFTLLFSTFFTNLDGWFRGAFDSIAYWLGEQKTGRADQPWPFYLYLLSLYELGIAAFALFGGLRLYFRSGKASYFFLKFLAFIPFVLAIFLLVNFPKSPPMVPVMALFAVFGGAAAAWSSFEDKPGNHFKVFLLYWSMLALVMFTIAGERMPWLTLHPLTPLTLLAALYLDEFFNREESSFAEHWLAWAVLALPLAVLAVMLPRQLLQAIIQAPREILSWMGSLLEGGRHGSFQASGWALNAWKNPYLPMLGAVLAGVAVLAGPLVLQRWPQVKAWTRGVFVALGVLALASLSHGTMNLLFRGDGADPREQLVYVQSSIELPELASKLERMSRALTGGPYLKVAVEDSCSWPMSWYLRDLERTQIGFGAPLTADKVKDFPVVMTGYDETLSPNHDRVVADSFAATHNAYPVRFRRWWAPDKNAYFQGDLPDQARRAWRLFMYREPWTPSSPIYNPRFRDYVYPKGDSTASPFGSFDACVWVRRDVDRYFQ